MFTQLLAAAARGLKWGRHVPFYLSHAIDHRGQRQSADERVDHDGFVVSRRGNGHDDGFRRLISVAHHETVVDGLLSSVFVVEVVCGAWQDGDHSAGRIQELKVSVHDGAPHLASARRTLHHAGRRIVHGVRFGFLFNSDHERVIRANRRSPDKGSRRDQRRRIRPRRRPSTA